MFTISRLARRFKLSRSTLLYYDRIGLLQPSARSGSNYRAYSAEDVRRLEQICMYRRTGLPLREIGRILEVKEDGTAVEALKNRLEDLDGEIRLLRDQQRVIVDILRCSSIGDTRIMNKERWTELLRAAGLDDRAMHTWHREFERLYPEGHRDFLESLGIPEPEIRLIREWSKPAKGHVPEE